MIKITFSNKSHSHWVEAGNVGSGGEIRHLGVGRGERCKFWEGIWVQEKAEKAH